jgi:uncharacterized membrane protein YccC
MNYLQEFYTDHIDPDGIQPLQAIRTTIAGLLAIVLYRSLDWPQAYWILLSTVLILQTYIGDTPKERFIYLTITGICATVATYLASRLCMQPLALAFFLMFSTFICLYLNVINNNVGNIAYYINIFCLSAGALAVGATDSWQRAVCVLLGTLVAMVVCLCFWPDRLSKQIQQAIIQNLYRLSEFNRVLSERTADEKAIAVRRNRLLRGLQLGRQHVPLEEFQAHQIIQKIEHLYEIIINFYQLKHYVHEQKVLRAINREISIISRRMTWLLRGIARSLNQQRHFPDVGKFIHTLLTFEKIYQRYAGELNQGQFLAFTVYIDTVHKLEKTITDLLELLEKKFHTS